MLLNESLDRGMISKWFEGFKVSLLFFFSFLFFQTSSWALYYPFSQILSAGALAWCAAPPQLVPHFDKFLDVSGSAEWIFFFFTCRHDSLNIWEIEQFRRTIICSAKEGCPNWRAQWHFGHFGVAFFWRSFSYSPFTSSWRLGRR